MYTHTHMNSSRYSMMDLNTYTNGQQQVVPQQQQQMAQQSFLFFGQSITDSPFVSQASASVSGLDTNLLRAELIKEKALRQKVEQELEQHKRMVTDLTSRVQYAYFMMIQMQEAHRLNNSNQMQMLENAQLKEKIECLQKENERLSKELEDERMPRLDQEGSSDDKDQDGFDVDKIYSTKNELLLMALNYDLTSRHTPTSS
ncbi:unnamed protein product [Cylicocyclus nassatus]|uniref:Uncharacterized protein n=1 Tax=Cylicocyclus nassatus TaxID=53992 RepID=A0AA36GIX0_CYLNA|nr:unnamed protein product [Cylicocyclus nassatus]